MLLEVIGLFLVGKVKYFGLIALVGQKLMLGKTFFFMIYGAVQIQIFLLLVTEAQYFGMRKSITQKIVLMH